MDESVKNELNPGRGRGQRLVQDDKALPHDLKAEQAVLGAILVDSPCLNEAIEKFGKDSGIPVFYSITNQKIYDVILDLYKKDVGIDLISVSKALSDKGILDEVGGDIYLAELQNSIVTTANMETWCNITHDMAVLRRLIASCTEAVEDCMNSDEEVSKILDNVERSILKARDLGAKNTIIPIKELLGRAAEYFQSLLKGDETVKGISTGFPGFDEKIIGMRPGEMIVLAARPSVGKTSFALNVLANVALKNVNPRSVLIFTMEMTADQITRRLLCSEAGISERAFAEKTASRADWPKITNAASRLQKASILIDPTPAMRVMEMRAKARRVNNEKKIDLIIIDYLQLMREEVSKKVESRQLEVSMISSGIKSLAKELNIPILVLAQLNRATEQQKDGRPRLSNLRESGAIEQDADIVAFLHRDIDEHRNASEEEKEKGLSAELIIGKNRNGDVGKADLVFFPKITKFRCATKYSDENVPQFEK